MTAPAWWPTLKVEFQWGYGLADSWTDTFTDEVDRVRSISIRNGRDDELQSTQASTATIVLDNRDGALDPSVNTDVRPNVRVKIRATVTDGTVYTGTTTYSLFFGFTDSFTPSWDSSWGETITVECVDALALLALYPYTATHGSETTKARFDTIGALVAPSYVVNASAYVGPLGASGWQTIPAKTYTRASLLDVLNEIALAEDGVVSVTNAGVLQLDQRYSRGGNPGTDPQFTDEPTIPAQYEYETVELDYSTQYVYNDVTVTDDSANTATAYYGESVALYGDRKLDVSIPVDDAAEVRRRAEWLAYMYGEPRLRVKSLVLRPAPMATDLDAWHVAFLYAQPATNALLVEGHRPAGTFSQGCIVEGYSHDIDASGDWVVTLTTSPVWIVPALYDFDIAEWAYDVGRYG